MYSAIYPYCNFPNWCRICYNYLLTNSFFYLFWGLLIWFTIKITSHEQDETGDNLFYFREWQQKDGENSHQILAVPFCTSPMDHTCSVQPPVSVWWDKCESQGRHICYGLSLVLVHCSLSRMESSLYTWKMKITQCNLDTWSVQSTMLSTTQVCMV